MSHEHDYRVTELEDKKSRHHLIITITIFQKTNTSTTNISKRDDDCLKLKIPPFWKFPTFSKDKWLLLWLL